MCETLEHDIESSDYRCKFYTFEIHSRGLMLAENEGKLKCVNTPL